MPYRKIPMVQKEIYHVYNKSIAEFRIFNSYYEYKRMIDCIVFYSLANPPCRFSYYNEVKKSNENISYISKIKNSKKIIKILAYCIMPTHIHLILQQLEHNAISRFINLILKSYSKYFNMKHHRKGPLWEGRFKNVLVETDEQLLHLTRYIHLNPTTAYLVNDAKDWEFSSYREYLNIVNKDNKICNFHTYLNIDSSYEEFVNNRIDYQRELAKIKLLVLEYPHSFKPALCKPALQAG